MTTQDIDHTTPRAVRKSKRGDAPQDPQQPGTSAPSERLPSNRPPTQGSSGMYVVPLDTPSELVRVAKDTPLTTAGSQGQQSPTEPTRASRSPENADLQVQIDGRMREIQALFSQLTVVSRGLELALTSDGHPAHALQSFFGRESPASSSPPPQLVPNRLSSSTGSSACTGKKPNGYTSGNAQCHMLNSTAPRSPNSAEQEASPNQQGSAHSAGQPNPLVPACVTPP